MVAADAITAVAARLHLPEQLSYNILLQPYCIHLLHIVPLIYKHALFTLSTGVKQYGCFLLSAAALKLPIFNLLMSYA